MTPEVLAKHSSTGRGGLGRVGKGREGYEGLRAERAEVPLNGGDAGILWAEYSPFPGEAGIAGRRYKQLVPLYTDPWALLMAVCEAAFEGHHAAGSCRGDYLRSRAARIREVVYAEQKERPEVTTRGLRSIAAILGQPAGSPTGGNRGDQLAPFQGNRHD